MCIHIYIYIYVYTCGQVRDARDRVHDDPVARRGLLHELGLGVDDDVVVGGEVELRIQT